MEDLLDHEDVYGCIKFYFPVFTKIFRHPREGGGIAHLFFSAGPDGVQAASVNIDYCDVAKPAVLKVGWHISYGSHD